MSEKHLVRSQKNCKICGVCGGIGEYFNFDPTLVRLLWVVLSIFPGSFIGGVIAYIIAAVIIPEVEA